MRIAMLKGSLFFCLLLPAAAAEFHGQWPGGVERPWAGPDYWTNTLQDWRVRGGRLECFVSGGERSAFLLTREVAATRGEFRMSVRLGRLEGESGPLDPGFVGFRLGMRGYFRDYRDSAVRGIGMHAGISTDGVLFIGSPAPDAPRVTPLPAAVQLRLEAQPANGAYRMMLAVLDAGGNTLAQTARDGIPAEFLTGGVALICHHGKLPASPDPASLASADPEFAGKPGTARGGNLRFWFRDWMLSGSKVVAYEDRAFGPILFAMHTLSRKVLKLTAQMAPVEASQALVHLETRGSASGAWMPRGTAAIDPLSRTATFHIAGWDDTRDTLYRLRYRMPDPAGVPRDYTYSGTVRKDPVSKPRIVVAAFKGNNDFGFPHTDILKHVSHFRPDFLVFTGDQIYERVADYGVQRSPLGTATLDYLRKWYLLGWEYRDLLKDTPAVCLPDDHDVYHGNIWGAGGRHAEGEGYEGQDKGGYTMPAEWVNMVQRTQTSHMPDPYDPAPIDQDISVYYTAVLYGGVSFAVVEDRKWKSAPREFLPTAKIVNGWPQNPDYVAARDGDARGAELLGSRQIRFLNEWAKDWSGGAWMKAVISQTIFANVATLPATERSDGITPKLRILAPGEYPENEAPVMDHDSNGWPQTPRNEALRAMRRAMAFHIAGDQHLGSTVQYGIDAYGDAAWALCVPAVANVWPRRWYPATPGANRKPGSPRYTGDFLDGFGNHMTVHAVSNPLAVKVEPVALHNRAPGYGIVEFDRATRRITMANWPRWVDPSRVGARPYPGWPITIRQTDNGLSGARWTLDPVTASAPDRVVEVTEQGSGEVVYTLRMQGTRFTPRVFREGVYSVRVFDPETGKGEVYRDRTARR